MEFFIEISEAADLDLEDIFDYSQSEHGIEQAVKYVSSFDYVFQSLAKHPAMGRERTEIRQGLNSVLKDFQVVFYRILMDRIRIVRVLHGARDIPRQFPDQVD